MSSPHRDHNPVAELARGVVAIHRVGREAHPRTWADLPRCQDSVDHGRDTVDGLTGLRPGDDHLARDLARTLKPLVEGHEWHVQRLGKGDVESIGRPDVVA